MKEDRKAEGEVPLGNLIRHTNECVKRIRGKGVSLKQNWDFAWELITAHLGKTFQVSSIVIEKRLDKDDIKENYRI
ncbi:MAG: hypothetical protein HY578_03905 [Nitrospinae bacterium]|nr:hypothetical protein [Nitrospinota bacterium]